MDKIFHIFFNFSKLHQCISIIDPIKCKILLKEYYSIILVQIELRTKYYIIIYVLNIVTFF